MTESIRVLSVEDSEDDAELLRFELVRNGYDPIMTRVASKTAMQHVLEREQFDIIISDYAMPGFSGLAALEVAKQYGFDIPFIVVSGTIGEDVAVTAMKAGAHDYVMKNNMARLIPAIQRELAEARMRKERREADAILFRERERAQVTVESIGDGVITTDITGKVEYINPVAERLTGWNNIDAHGQELDQVMHLIDEFTRLDLPNPVKNCLHEATSVCLPNSTILLARNKKQQFSIEVTASPLRGYHADIIGCVLVLHDVTELRGMARQMSYQATHDALTGLVNRREFEHRLEEALVTARRDNRSHAMCYLDLDQFKVVNDTCGHIAGDELLKQLAAHLHTVVRETDTLARLGGDEFGVLLENCPLKKAEEIANELRNIVKSFRFAWQDKIFDVGVSVGLVQITAASGGLSDVMSSADSACYVAKDHGRNRVQVFQSDNLDLADRHGEMQWVTQITKGMEDNRFVLYAQMLSSIGKNQQAGQHYEILIRLLDENNSLVPPAKFIPAAERYNIMPRLDRWVISTVFGYLAQLVHDVPSYNLDNDMCAINLSGTTLSDEQLLEFIQEQLHAHGLPPGMFCFEITETSAIANLSRASRLIRELRHMGCRFALDDFGTGLSSFSYLKNLQVDYLKIDGGFVMDMLQDPLDHAIVSSINQIGHVMGIKTIAESVENNKILGKLEHMGVDFAQGFAIAKPRPLEQVLLEMRRHSLQRAQK